MILSTTDLPSNSIDILDSPNSPNQISASFSVQDSASMKPRYSKKLTCVISNTHSWHPIIDAPKQGHVNMALCFTRIKCYPMQNISNRPGLIMTGPEICCQSQSKSRARLIKTDVLYTHLSPTPYIPFCHLHKHHKIITITCTISIKKECRIWKQSSINSSDWPTYSHNLFQRPACPHASCHNQKQHGIHFHKCHSSTDNTPNSPHPSFATLFYSGDIPLWLSKEKASLGTRNSKSSMIFSIAKW